jgi:hypothetical protein
MRALLFIAAFLSIAPAWAQSPPPVEPAAVSAVTNTPSEQPTVSTQNNAVPVAKPVEKGTTVVGDTDSPIGLFIMPWRNSSAEKDIDRPARLLQGDMSPIDQAVFDRQTEYFDVLEAHTKKAGTAAKP